MLSRKLRGGECEGKGLCWTDIGKSIFSLKAERGPERSDLQSWEGWFHLGRNILSLVKGQRDGACTSISLAALP